MAAKTILLALMLALGTVALAAPVAPMAAATHSCGIDIPCADPYDLCYVKVVNKIADLLGMC